MEGDTEVQTQAELYPFSMNAKSSVKLKNTTRGISWEIKVVTGEEHLIDSLTKAAIKAHKDIIKDLNLKGGK